MLNGSATIPTAQIADLGHAEKSTSVSELTSMLVMESRPLVDLERTRESANMNQIGLEGELDA